MSDAMGLTGRARRRHDRWRMVRRTARIMRTSWLSVPWFREDGRYIPFPSPSSDAPQRWADNLRKCSCFICSGRKRSQRGPTMRERRLVEPRDA